MEKNDETPDMVSEEALFTPVLFEQLLRYRKANQIREWEADEAMVTHMQRCIHAAVEMGQLAAKEVYYTEEHHDGV